MDDRKLFIYMTTNMIDGKRYIGQHKGYEYDEYLGSGVRIVNAVKKYGKENFKREIICYCDTQEELDEQEIYWIKYYDAANSEDFYNIAEGGNGTCKTTGLTEEQEAERRRKISKAMSGPENPMYGVHLCGEDSGMYGKHHSEESKLKMRNAKLGRTLPEEQKKKISLNNPNVHSVDAYDEDGNFVKHFRTLRDANAFIGLNKNSTGRLKEAIEKNKFYHGYYFKNSK